MNDMKIKRCQFCGKTPEVIIGGNAKFSSLDGREFSVDAKIICNSCGIERKKEIYYRADDTGRLTMTKDGYADLIIWWNTRYQEDV